MSTVSRKAIASSGLPTWFATAAASWMALANTEARQPKPRVLVIDDEEARRELLSLFLEGKGLEVATVRSTDGARVLVEQGQFDLVILDWVRARAEGPVLLHRCKARHPAIPVIIFSNIGPEKGGVEGHLADEVDAVVRKGAPLQALSATIFRTLERCQVRPLEES